MIPFDLFLKLLAFDFYLSVVKGTCDMAWWQKGSVEEDEMLVNATDSIASALSDGDFVKQVELATGKNLRDQLTVEELKKMQDEVNYRRMGVRRN